VEASATPVAAATAAELDAYREQADRFIAERDQEYYLHYAGLKRTLDLEPIYARHAELTTLERALAIGAAAEADARVRELWRFAAEGHFGDVTREEEQRLAAAEAELTAEVDGDEIPFRMLRPAIANEPDRARRERLDRARTELTDERLNPVYVESWTKKRQTTRDLAAPTYLELYRRFGFRLDELAAECRAVLDETEDLWLAAGNRLLRTRVGVGLAEARRWDVARVFRASEWDEAFPKGRMLAALTATLDDLGLDLRAQENVQLDLEERPLKVPRAYCFPIDVPDRVVLMIKPVGGPDDWRALFHEAGHAEHFAHTSRDHPFEARRLGDNAVTEGWAALLEHLVDEPAWLQRRLDVPRPQEFSADGAAQLLYIVRRYAAKLLYEVELHAADDLEAMRPRYVELLADALHIEPSGTDFLADVDDGFYASSYLRSWALEAQLRSFLQEEFGHAWFARREAGSLLRELWAEGQRWTADELLRELTGAELELAAVVERVSERAA
jgi:hypothetical protein